MYIHNLKIQLNKGWTIARIPDGEGTFTTTNQPSPNHPNRSSMIEPVISEMDESVAEYEEEVDNAVDAMSSLMEPLIMAVLGVLIGGLVVAMYLPIFKMGQVV